MGRKACLLNDEPIRIYVPLLLRSSALQICHSTASCHLGTARTPRMFERFYWWIGMSIRTWWWLRNCLKFEARKTSRQTVRWLTTTMPLPEGPGIAVSIDYFGPLPVTPRGVTYILLLTDRFSRRADMSAVTAAEFAAEARLTLSSIGISPSGDSRAVSSRITASTSVPSVRTPIPASRSSEKCYQLPPPKWQR